MSDDILVLDMLIAAREALTFIAGLDEAQFSQSRLHQWAVVKQIEIIGEAANRVSPAYQQSQPLIPWRQIIGMRHRLVHDYTNIDLPTVWATISQDLPILAQQLAPLVPPDSDVSPTAAPP